MKTVVRRDDLVYPELCYQLVGYAYEVFSELGPGHSEKTYQKAYSHMLHINHHKFEEQVYYPVRFKDEIISRGFLDFKVDEKIIIELKKDERFSKAHIEQVLDYIKRSGLKLAVLINFAKQGVQFKRVVNINQEEHS
jgi:GxxExxY protein